MIHPHAETATVYPDDNTELRITWSVVSDPGVWRDANGDGRPPSTDYQVVAAELDILDDDQTVIATLSDLGEIEAELTWRGMDAEKVFEDAEEGAEPTEHDPDERRD